MAFTITRAAGSQQAATCGGSLKLRRLVLVSAESRSAVNRALRRRIELPVDANDLQSLIFSWCTDFRENELTVEDIQERFAALDVSGAALAPAIRKRIVESKRELDGIRWGMCERGQRAEIERIFAELQRLFAATT
jgi:hypothetical protein